MVRQDVNIGISFARIALEFPDLEAIVAADIRLTYAKLWRIARGFAVRFQDLGIGRNSTVAVQTTDMIAALASMLAASLVGARYVTLNSDLISDGVIFPTHFLRSPEVKPLPDILYVVMDGEWPASAAARNDLDEGEFPGYADPEDPWWILNTSGTTGNRKYIIISQHAVYARSKAVHSDFRALQTRFCPLFPCHTRPFFVRATAALLNACTIVDSIDIAFMQANGVTLVCGSPRTAIEWLGDQAIIPKIPLLQVSGAKLSDAHAAILLRSFDVVEDVYGSSETNKAFVNLSKQNGDHVVKTGCVQDSQVEIIDENGNACPPNKNGFIRIRNGYMASEYLGMAEVSKKVFRDGWFYPGDVGHWGSGGELVVDGRNDDIINLGGSKIDPASLEEVLCSVPGITAAACFRDPLELNPPRMMAVVTLSEMLDVDTCLHSAYRECHDLFGENVAPHIIYVVDAIPLTKDGTPNRNGCLAIAKTFKRPDSVTNTFGEH